jgi:cysteine desulfurase
MFKVEKNSNIVYADVSGSARVAASVKNLISHMFTTNEFANPNSAHALGMKVMDRIETSRFNISKILGCRGEQIIFNSGSSEGITSIFNHFFIQNKKQDSLILYSSLEHQSVLKNVQRCQQFGSVELMTIDHIENGYLNLSDLEEKIVANKHKKVLLCIMHAHNETGVVQPLDKISTLAKKYNVKIFSDMTQSIGKIIVNLDHLDIDFAVASGHKFGALTGIGFMYIKDIDNFTPLIVGGGQESNIRSGTQNYIGIYSLSVALAEKTDRMATEYERYDFARNHFENKLKSIFQDSIIIGEDAKRIPLVSFISTPYNSSKKIQSLLSENNIYISTGSACSDRKNRVSKSVLGLGLDLKYAGNTNRFSLEDTSFEEDYRTILEVLFENFRELP